MVVNLTLPATGTVDVLVTEEDMTTPVPGVDILFLDSFSAAFRAEGATDEDGRRSITTVPEGAFTVRVELAGEVIDAVDTIVQNGDVIEVTFVRLAGATVEGLVFGIDSQTPVPSATVDLRSSDGSMLIDSTTTDSEGAFVFTDAMDPGESRVVRALFTDDTSKQVEETVSATEPGELFTLSMDLPVSVIVGRVLESDGVTPVANAFPEVDRQIGNSFEFIFGTADAGGHFLYRVQVGREQPGGRRHGPRGRVRPRPSEWRAHSCEQAGKWKPERLERRAGDQRGRPFRGVQVEGEQLGAW